MMDRALTHGLSSAWWGEEGMFPHKYRAGREDNILSTVPRANYSEAVRHTFYFVIIDLEEGQNSCLAGDNFSQSLCRETILTHIFFFFFLVCYHWHFQLIGFASTQLRIYCGQKQTKHLEFTSR